MTYLRFTNRSKKGKTDISRPNTDAVEKVSIDAGASSAGRKIEAETKGSSKRWEKVTAISTAILALGVAVSAASLWITNRNTTDQLDIARSAQNAERYAKGVEMLSSDKSDARLGAIYALRDLALGTPSYRNQVVQTLATYVERTTPHTSCNLRPGIQLPFETEAALSAVGSLPLLSDQAIERRSKRGVTVDNLFNRGNLPNCWYGVRLSNSDFRGYSFSISWPSYPDPPGAGFTFADLDDVNFSYTVMQKAAFISAQLSEVQFKGADLSYGNFSTSSIMKTNFQGANLTGANFCRALFGPLGIGAEFANASVYGASFKYARLEGVDFSHAKISKIDLTGASWDETTKWPADFSPPSARQSTDESFQAQNQYLNTCNTERWEPPIDATMTPQHHLSPS